MQGYFYAINVKLDCRHKVCFPTLPCEKVAHYLLCCLTIEFDGVVS